MLIKDWQIRKAQIADFNYFYQAMQEVYGIAIEEQVFNKQFIKKVNSKTSFIYILETVLGNQIGFIVCDKVESFIDSKPNLQIHEFYISPNYRKMHLADELFLHIYEKASKLGFNKIEVLCNLTSTTTQNFYTRKKFKPTKKLFIKHI
jgi:GNAT superfamily N-acetyltransferase